MMIVIPMAGLGSRFTAAGYVDHKPLIRVDGKTLLQYTVESLDLDGEYRLVCRDMGDDYKKAVNEVMKSLGVVYKIYYVDKLTSGAAETALIAMDDAYDDELIVTNCDQYLEWDSGRFLSESRKYDSSVLTYSSRDPKNSFVEMANDRVVRIVEKQAVSDTALVGVHYWKRASYFKKTAEQFVKDRDPKRETYVSETYNYLIRSGISVGAVPIEPGKYYSTGTPEDLAVFKGVVLEYFTPKPKTYFFDLDGTVLMHAHAYSNLKNAPALCPGVKKALDEIDSRGDKIVLVSARKESARKLTQEVLDELMVPYDQLVLGVSQGTRIIVNDKLEPDSPSRCKSVDVLTDKGWSVSDL